MPSHPTKTITKKVNRKKKAKVNDGRQQGGLRLHKKVATGRK